ncbi:HMG domain-containing protein 4 [Taenia crassiceps]|uniref:HMG domain-containing protein 4 n=1 Tax=Taenia crassiceps TaxID=6207 RepID=A0ABR4QN03_9CEST
MSESTATPHQDDALTAPQSCAQPQRGTIPIYRRGYGAVRSRGVTPRPLVWEDGRLRQVEVPEQSSNNLPFPGAVVGRGGIFPPSSLPPPSSSISSAAGGDGTEGSMEFRSPLLRGRGRTVRQRGRGKGLTPFTPSSRSSCQREGGTPAFRMPEFNANLPSPRKRPILPTDPSLPPFSLSVEDPIPPNSVLFPALESDQVNGNVSGPMSKKMKSSGVDDLDIETLKTYRRLNGYTLFTLAMKKKYGVSNDDGGQDQKSQNRRWQALWSTLPERDRQQWRVRARRMQKAVEAAPEKNLAAEAKRANELRRAETQLARSETSKYTLLDLAAHFQLLSDVFARAADLMGEYRGVVSMEEVTSSLLDALLTCLIPLTAIASEMESLAGAPDKTTVCSGLSSLAHIFPNF